jgi:hypothetical protein
MFIGRVTVSNAPSIMMRSYRFAKAAKVLCARGPL